MEKSYETCVKALNLAFDTVDRLETWTAPDTQLLREASTGFPMLHAMARDMTPDLTSDGSIGMIAALSSAFQALGMEYDDVFEGSPPGQEELAEVDELLVEEDDDLRERVVRTIPRAEELFASNLTDRQGGFLIGFCLVVNWLDHNVPEDLYTTSDKLGELLADAEAPPSFEEEIAAATAKAPLVDAYEAPEIVEEAPASGDFRDTVMKLLSFSRGVHISELEGDVLLEVRLTDPEVTNVVRVAELVKRSIPVQRQYVHSLGSFDQIQVVSVLK